MKSQAKRSKRLAGSSRTDMFIETNRGGNCNNREATLVSQGKTVLLGRMLQIVDIVCQNSLVLSHLAILYNVP
jgi:hypothetical protein